MFYIYVTVTKAKEKTKTLPSLDVQKLLKTHQ